jgi:hypothetical protein
MNNHPLGAQLRDWGEDIGREYERASAKGGKASPSDVAEFRETIVSEFVASYFPFPFRMAKGVIRDVRGLDSASTDVILLNPIHPYTANNSKKSSLILADGVEAAIEVKSDSGKAAEIQSALSKVAKTKRLRRVNHSLLATAKIGGKRLSGEQRVRYEDYWKEVPAFVFFEKPSPDPAKAASEIASALSSFPMRSRPDAIVINMGGIIVNEKLGSQFGYVRPGAYYESWGELTLAGFLLLLNMVPSASLRLQPPFLAQYLEPLRAQLSIQELNVGMAPP